MHKIFILSSVFLTSLFGKVTEPQKVVVLGSGVGGLTSALYLARAGIETLVIDGPLSGGLITQSHSVQNWPGEVAIGGEELSAKIRKQVVANGVHFLQKDVVKVDFSASPLKIQVQSLDGKKEWMAAKSCIIAMGTTPNFLGIPGEKKYWGRGVSNCAICDGSLYKDKVVGVVGGGDAAVLEALYLSDLAKKVELFVRKEHLKAVEQKRVKALLAKPNVTLFLNTVVTEVEGDEEGVTAVSLQREGKEEKVAIDGLFLAIGSKPNSELFQGKLKLDPQGYLALTQGQETSVKGVYAVGDIVDPLYKQAITAAGDGAKAALQAQEFLMDQAPATVEIPIEKEVQAQGKVIEIESEEQFASLLKRGEGPAIVDFYATWCAPCKRVFPSIEAAASVLAGKVHFYKVNVDKVKGLSQEYKIKAMPTVLLLDQKGEVLERKVGQVEIVGLLKNLEQKFSQEAD